MLNFNKHGYLEPNKPINSSIAELERVFVIEYSSVERSKLFEEFLRCNKDLKSLCDNIELKQWVNGSFVSKFKKRPNDIDLVTFIDINIIKSLGEKIKPFVYPYSKKNYKGVDAYIVESNCDLYLYDKAYWHQQFDTTRRNSKTGKKLSKGFLEIIY